MAPKGYWALLARSGGGAVIVLAAMTVTAVALAAVMLQGSLRLSVEGVRTDAIVVGHDVEREFRQGSQHTVYRLSVRFPLGDGEPMTLWLVVGPVLHRDARAGDVLPLIYAASNPRVASLQPGRARLHAVGVAVLASSLIAATALTYLRGRTTVRAAVAARLRGAVVRAEVVGHLPADGAGFVHLRWRTSDGRTGQTAALRQRSAEQGWPVGAPLQLFQALDGSDRLWAETEVGSRA